MNALLLLAWLCGAAPVDGNACLPEITDNLCSDEDESEPQWFLHSPILKKINLKLTWARRDGDSIAIATDPGEPLRASMWADNKLVTLKPSNKLLDLQTGCGSEMWGKTFALPKQASPCDAVVLGRVKQALNLQWYAAAAATRVMGADKKPTVVGGTMPLGRVELKEYGSCPPGDHPYDPNKPPVQLLRKLTLTKADGKIVVLDSARPSCESSESHEVIGNYLGTLVLSVGKDREIWAVYRVGGWEWFGIKANRLKENGEVADTCASVFLGGGC